MSGSGITASERRWCAGAPEFAGAFQRSELVAVNCNDIEHVPDGIIINLRRSKTDQEGRGRISDLCRMGW